MSVDLFWNLMTKLILCILELKMCLERKVKVRFKRSATIQTSLHLQHLAINFLKSN